MTIAIGVDTLFGYVLRCSAMRIFQFGRAALVVLVVVVIAGCGGVSIRTEVSHSLLGTWTAPSTCTLPNNERGTGTLTMTFGENRWYVYRYCESENFFRYRADGGRWSIDGDVVTRARYRRDEVETARKTITWMSGGTSFETHPFHWSGDDRPDSRRTYTLVSRNTLPVSGIEGDWYVRENGVPHTRFTFNPDGSFELWIGDTFQDDNGVEQSYDFTTTGSWRPRDVGDGTIQLFGIEISGVYSEYPGQIIRASSDIVAEVGIAPGPSEDFIVIWQAVESIPSNVEGFSLQVPVSQRGDPFTSIWAFAR